MGCHFHGYISKDSDFHFAGILYCLLRIHALMKQDVVLEIKVNLFNKEVSELGDESIFSQAYQMTISKSMRDLKEKTQLSCLQIPNTKKLLNNKYIVVLSHDILE